MRRKPFNDRPGYVCSLRSGLAGGYVVVYEAAAAGIEVASFRYAVRCETHGAASGTSSMPRARGLMKAPGAFCKACLAGGVQ